MKHKCLLKIKDSGCCSVPLYLSIYLSEDDKLYQSTVTVSEKLSLMKHLQADVYNVPLYWHFFKIVTLVY